MKLEILRIRLTFHYLVTLPPGTLDFAGPEYEYENKELVEVLGNNVGKILSQFLRNFEQFFGEV